MSYIIQYICRMIIINTWKGFKIKTIQFKCLHFNIRYVFLLYIIIIYYVVYTLIGKSCNIGKKLFKILHI